MNKILILLAFLLGANGINGQDSTDKYQEHVSSMDNILESLYAVISGDPGVERDWELFRHLFVEESKLIPSVSGQEGVMHLRFLKPEEYIEQSGPWLINNGFFEKEIHRVVEEFGAIAHVFSTYEAFRTSSDTQAFMRGINSIQLFNDGKRWWIVNIYWMQESDSQPIPEKYLP